MRNENVAVLVAVSKGMQAVKIVVQQNPPVLKCGCWLTHIVPI